MEWLEEDSLKMIDLYKARPLLWDPTHKDYFRKKSKDKAWREISAHLQIDVDECRRKMISLLSSYRRERFKIKKKIRTIRGKNGIYETRWYAYEALHQFLKHRDNKKLITETHEIPDCPKKDDVEEEIENGDMLSEPKATKRNHKTIPKPSQRAKDKGEDGNLSMMNTAFNFLKTAATVLEKEPSQQNSSGQNENDAFFKYVAAKVKKYSPEAKIAVQYNVFELLMQADRGDFDWNSRNVQYSGDWQSTAESGPNPFMDSEPQQSVPSLINQE